MIKSCRVCNNELPIVKFGTTKYKKANGEIATYVDSTCMVCRRKKHLEKPGKKEIHRQGSRKWYYSNPEQAKTQRLRRYNIDYNKYNQLREQQKYCCAICGTHEDSVIRGRSKSSATALCVDHNHSTGQVRSLLCTNCNTLIGKAKEDVSILNAAIEYLRKHNENTQC
jgi:hypothetical protein